jgi:CheY-like chemotaxis protein
MTDLEFKEDQERCLQVGMADYISKTVVRKL